MDRADDKYDKNLIEDVKSLLRVLVLFIPLPLFWALFDQQVCIIRTEIKTHTHLLFANVGTSSPYSVVIWACKLHKMF